MWQGISWIVNGEIFGCNVNQVMFIFEFIGIYIGVFGIQEEVGIYCVEGNKLYMYVEGQVEKMVEVVFLGVDMFCMNMNWVGMLEVLVLIKE